MLAVPSQSFTGTCRAVKIWGHLIRAPSSQLKWNKATLPSCFNSHAVNKHPFHGLFSDIFFAFLCCLSVIPLFKWPVSVLLRCYLVLLRARRMWRTLQRKYACVVNCDQAWVMVLLAMSLMLIDQHYILNHVSWNRNTNKTRLCIDQLTEMSWPEVHRNLTLYFS